MFFFLVKNIVPTATRLLYMLKTTSKKAAAARARRNRHPETADNNSHLQKDPDVNHQAGGALPEPTDITLWEGGVNNVISEDEWTYEEELDDGDLEIVELTDPSQEPVENSKNQTHFETQMAKELTGPNPLTILVRNKSKKYWLKSEANRALGYNGLSVRRAQELRKAREDKEKIDSVKRQG